MFLEMWLVVMMVLHLRTKWKIMFITSVLKYLLCSVNIVDVVLFGFFLVATIDAEDPMGYPCTNHDVVVLNGV